MRAFYKSVGYPEKMRKAGVTGHIYALLYLNKTGSVDSLIEIKSRLKNKEYYPEFFEALREAVNTTKWKPATVYDGQPIQGFVELHVFFPQNQWQSAPENEGRETQVTVGGINPEGPYGRYLRIPYFSKLVKNSETITLDGRLLERGTDYWPDDVMTLKLADDLQLDENSKIIFKFRYLEN